MRPSYPNLILLIFLLSSCASSIPNGIDMFGPYTDEELNEVFKDMSDDLPLINTQPPLEKPLELQDYVLDGYKILDFEEGDLNGDGKDDVLLLLTDLNEPLPEIETSRPLLILIRQEDDSLLKVRQNDDLVYPLRDRLTHYDPYVDMVIEGDTFFVRSIMDGWIWARSLAFGYNDQDQEWYLFKDEGILFHAANPLQTRNHAMRTVDDFGKITFESFNIYETDMPVKYP